MSKSSRRFAHHTVTMVISAVISFAVFFTLGDEASRTGLVFFGMGVVCTWLAGAAFTVWAFDQ